MTEICIFAGTTEGRELAAFLSKQPVQVMVCVATAYGSDLIEPSENVTVSDQKLSLDEMMRMMEKNRFDLVIDATHPYAVQVTDNIIGACQQTGTPYKRLIREKSNTAGNTIIVPNVQSAVEFLNDTTGNILLTTGSKELSAFSNLKNFSERVFARVLPMQQSLGACTAAGLLASHIIAMQGPFTEAINSATLQMINAAWLVTKDSGDIGGFAAKISAAEKNSVKTVIIGCPPQTEGVTKRELLKFLREEFGFTYCPEVIIAGIGPGSRGNMTTELIEAIQSADCLIGAQRMLSAVPWFQKGHFTEVRSEAIAEIIHDYPEFSRFAVLMSGDSSFYSGTKNLLKLLPDCNVRILPGISSLSYLCTRIGRSYENIPTISLHGRNQPFLREIAANPAVFLLTGGENSAEKICEKLCDTGFGDLKLTVGERLSYPDEKITSGKASDFCDKRFDSLSVILVENDHPVKTVTHGLPDSLFLRDSGEKGIIPMTKSEIRSIAISKLQLTDNAICWDIGSGTGSVAVEMALQARNGQVFGIEKDAEAITLSKKNANRFHTDNLQFIQGTAPEIFPELQTPTHVFIGGASGNIAEILQHLSARNADIRVVITAVTLDTVAEIYAITQLEAYRDTEVVMIQTAQGKKAGMHQLMLGGNPVYIFSLQIKGCGE